MSDDSSFGRTHLHRKVIPTSPPTSQDLGWDHDSDFGHTVRPMSTGTLVFGRFALKSQLGRGGMGVVWLAEDEKAQRQVALKFVPELVRLDEAAVAELRRETKRGMQMNHPHIVRVHDFAEDDLRAAIVMEYIEGGTLAGALLKQPARIFEAAALRGWVEQLLDALEYTHSSMELYHRDLKPANLMITAEKQLKITDFGIACSLRDSASRVSVKGAGAGTLLYMSPQQLFGGSPTASDDIYSVGATLYELLTSKPPFHGGDLTSQVQSKVPISMTERRTEYGISGAPIPREWERTIAACLAKDPGGRPRDIAALRSALKGEPFEYGSALSLPSPIAVTPSYPSTFAPPVNPAQTMPQVTGTPTYPPYTAAPLPAPTPQKSVPAWVWTSAGLAVAAIVAVVVAVQNDGTTQASELPSKDDQQTTALTKVAEMRKGFEAVRESTTDQTTAQQAREWRKFYDSIRDFSTIHSSEDDELRNRARSLAESAEREVRQEEIEYAKMMKEMQDEGSTLIKEEEREDKAAALKQKGWSDFIAKWSAIKVPEIVGVEHQAILQMARDNEQEWARKARNERQMTSGLGDLFTEDHLKPWRVESKEELLKLVQTRLKTEGLYTGNLDGEYGQNSSLAIISYQQAQGFPATGKLDKHTLDKLGVARAVEPSPPVVAGRSRGGDGTSGSQGAGGSREPQPYEKAAGWVRAFSPLANRLPHHH